MSRASALTGMDSSPLRPIEFPAALAEMQGMIGKTVLVTLSLGELFFGAAFRARLELVETMPPDESAVVLRFEHGEAVPLDPDEVEVFLGGRVEGHPRWLEFQIHRGPILRLEVSNSEQT
jgi:hypothetical protein